MYRSLRTKILLHLQSEAHKMLVVTSLNVAEGKSLTASNLSIVMAQQKLRTLLIDGDMRKGVQHHSFVLEKKPGLSELLSSPDDLINLPINTFLQKTHIPNLSLLSCGMPIPNPAECMNSNKFRNLVSVLTKWFDVVVLDTPPLRVAVDAAILPEAFDHYIIVARAAKTSLDALEKKVNDFPGLRQKVLGIVLNGSPVDKKMYNYAYSYYRH
jgi:capsular exopolysaccharide synthesis family protein